jgi:uncharacterized membrane protein
MASKILSRIELMNRKLSKVEKIEEHLDKLVNREERDIDKIEQRETKIEKRLIKVGRLEIKKGHILELIRGMAGAFLGVGLGQAVGGSVSIAQSLPWINTLGILAFILIFVGLIIYRKDKAEIEQEKRSLWSHVIRKLLLLYFISVVVQLFGLVLFNDFPGWNDVLARALIIGSYAAMSSAVAFTLI